ncbi:hypothetical protein PMIN03_009848 [Paraphaeosphaeria minitans]
MTANWAVTIFCYGRDVGGTGIITRAKEIRPPVQKSRTWAFVIFRPQHPIPHYAFRIEALAIGSNERLGGVIWRVALQTVLASMSILAALIDARLEDSLRPPFRPLTCNLPASFTGRVAIG